MPRFVVVAGPGGYPAQGLAEALGAELVNVEHKVFPDGESYVRIPSRLDGKIAVVVQSMYPEQDRRFVELLLLIEAAHGSGADHVIAVVPYIAYARQDRRFREGEPISIKTILSSLRAAGADALITIDIHKPESLTYFNGPTVNVDPTPLFAEAIRGEKDVVVVAPDRGALHRAESLAMKLNVPYDYLEKFRDRVTGEITMKPKELRVEGKTVILVDDIISTGGTIAKAAEILRSQGARRIIVAVSHALLVGNALEKLVKAGVDRLLALDTVPPRQGVEVLATGGLLADTVKELSESHGWLT
ncbi:ribose-phosphate pyrophosphokinase [Pyrolobus fumarii 1A]|uniref:Ribose-phosphate pyrophosphokinase n=1 Tax=Pyrolobus fumarii (strain DSM 11204 / 1A) TaxID=694429 RepID=G0ED15_PYRF1|nr:ribose-phosphate pyrophosphokinase [Pyrolobus fumarii]AEM38574.1 ribose-phosphate pyrophosphokinase [Pyrolobus fumarii 1A]